MTKIFFPFRFGFEQNTDLFPSLISPMKKEKYIIKGVFIWIFSYYKLLGITIFGFSSSNLHIWIRKCNFFESLINTTKNDF